jgi:hypothetical protein
MAVLVLLFAWSYVAATGASIAWAWQALLPLVVVTGGQLWLALWLYRLCRDGTATIPNPAAANPAAPNPAAPNPAAPNPAAPNPAAPNAAAQSTSERTAHDETPD